MTRANTHLTYTYRCTTDPHCYPNTSVSLNWLQVSSIPTLDTSASLPITHRHATRSPQELSQIGITPWDKTIAGSQSLGVTRSSSQRLRYVTCKCVACGRGPDAQSPLLHSTCCSIYCPLVCCSHRRLWHIHINSIGAGTSSLRIESRQTDAVVEWPCLLSIPSG